MNLEATGNENEVLDVRALTDAELDEANGGFIFLGLLAGGFAAASSEVTSPPTMCIPEASALPAKPRQLATQESRSIRRYGFCLSGLGANRLTSCGARNERRPRPAEGEANAMSAG